jgi:cell division protein FtsN
MENRTADTGMQFVLDNQKLIILFAVLIGICGGFFILGYVEGKRQGLQLGAQITPTVAATPITESAKNSQPPGAGESVKKDLNWYQDIGGTTPKDSQLSSPSAQPAEKTVQTQSVEPEKPITAEPKAKKQPAAAAVATKEVKQPAPATTEQKTKKQPAPLTAAAKASYSVQVGAFRQRKEAESKAAMLKGKGYESAIFSPSEPGQLYLLRVGIFDSRADAVGMQLRLKKDGFAGFVKTN